MSVTEDYGFSLGDELNQILQLSLKSYFELKENGGSLETILSDVPFRYKILRCHDYCKTGNGFLFAQYKNKVLDVVIGEFVLRVFLICMRIFLISHFWHRIFLCKRTN